MAVSSALCPQHKEQEVSHITINKNWASACLTLSWIIASALMHAEVLSMIDLHVAML